MLSAVKSQGLTEEWMTDLSGKKEINPCSTCTQGPGLHRWDGADWVVHKHHPGPKAGGRLWDRGAGAVNAGRTGGGARNEQYLEEEDLAVWISFLAHKSWQVLWGSWMLPVYDISEDSALLYWKSSRVWFKHFSPVKMQKHSILLYLDALQYLLPQNARNTPEG